MSEKNITKILVIEDEYTVRSSIRELLEANNYKVFSASDGIEGIQLAREIIPNLIICDVMMPKLDGFEVLNILREQSEFETVPFLFLTAKAELTDFRDGMDLGADDYITKPYRAANLLKAIEIRLKKNELLLDIQSEINHENEQESEKLNLYKEDEKILLKTKTGPQLINISQILFVTAQGEYSIAHLLSGEKFLTRKLVKQWEEQLPKNIFLRIHRSTIININYIQKIQKWYKRSYMVILKNFEENFIISQRYAGKLKIRLDL